MRIVSLLPSATEMVCAVGAEADLVGVSHECDWPPSVVGRPVLTSSKVHLAPRSGQIDRDIRALLKDALAVYDIDEAKLADARPDVIVTQDLCDVCAVSLDDVVAAVKKVCRPEVRVVNLRPLRLADIWADIRRVGEALVREREAEAVLADMDRRVADVKRRADAHLATGAKRPNVLTIEWLDPVMVGGTWMPELVEIAGGHALVTKAGDHAPTLTSEQLAALQPAPDVVLVKPCGFPLARTMDEIDTLATLLADMPWPAVANKRGWLADGNAYFNRPGPRIVDSLEILAACLWPDVFEDLAHQYGLAFKPIWSQPRRLADFEAEVRFLAPEQGGRQSQPPQGYRPDVVYADTVFGESQWMIWPLFLDGRGRELPLGVIVPRVVRANFYILNSELRRTVHQKKIREGVVLHVCEGARRVAEARVTKVLHLHDERHD